MEEIMNNPNPQPEAVQPPETAPQEVTPQDPAAAFLGTEGMPADPSTQGTSVLPGEEQVMREEIEEQFGKIYSRKAEADEKRKQMEEELENMKKKMVQEFFAMLQKVGVDPNNLESINTFLQELEYQNPDLMAMVEGFINLAYGEDPKPAAPMEEDPAAENLPTDPASPASAEPAPDLMEQQTTELQNNMLRQ